MTVMVAEDRSMCVQPHQVVRTGWVDIDLRGLSFRHPMSPEAVEKKYRRLLNLGECAPWPPVVGHWEGGRFVVCDGRHDYLAALMIGRNIGKCVRQLRPAFRADQAVGRPVRSSVSSATHSAAHEAPRRQCPRRKAAASLAPGSGPMLPATAKTRSRSELKDGVWRRLGHQPTTESQKLSDMRGPGGTLPGAGSITSSKRSSRRSCSP
jgi:hypothetical protein